ncbi:hypothetical protein Tco_1326276 [Tanacetum coccineum]
MESVKPRVLTPSRYAIDVEAIPPHNRSNREVHIYYLKHLNESVETFREIVEDAKVERPLDRSIISACRYTKHSQELLEYAIGTCLKAFNQRDKKHAPTPLIRKKQVTFDEQCDTLIVVLPYDYDRGALSSEWVVTLMYLSTGSLVISHCWLLYLMVNTRTDAELAAAVQAAVDAMLPQIHRVQARASIEVYAAFYRSLAGFLGNASLAMLRCRPRRSDTQEMCRRAEWYFVLSAVKMVILGEIARRTRGIGAEPIVKAVPLCRACTCELNELKDQIAQELLEQVLFRTSGYRHGRVHLSLCSSRGKGRYSVYERLDEPESSSELFKTSSFSYSYDDILGNIVSSGKGITMAFRRRFVAGFSRLALLTSLISSLEKGQLQLKKTMVKSGAIIQTILTSRSESFLVDSDGILWSGTKYGVPEDFCTSRGLAEDGSCQEIVSTTPVHSNQQFVIDIEMPRFTSRFWIGLQNDGETRASISISKAFLPENWNRTVELRTIKAHWRTWCRSCALDMDRKLDDLHPVYVGVRYNNSGYACMHVRSL